MISLIAPRFPSRPEPPRAAPHSPRRFEPHARTKRPRGIPHEFYPTPPAAVRALLSVERFDGDIWEPACGDGAITKTLIEAGYDVAAADLIDHGYRVSGLDFLTLSHPRAKHIVTNPPYGFGLADAFIRQALILTRQTGGAVAMLLDLRSLCHRTRTPRWRKSPPAALYAIDGVVCWPAKHYGPPPFTPTMRYVWAVWRPEHTGATTFGWLSASDFK